jgi:hypothetical protein
MLKTKNKFNKMRIVFIIKHKSRYHGSDHSQGCEEGLWSMELESRRVQKVRAGTMMYTYFYCQTQL